MHTRRGEALTPGWLSRLLKPTRASARVRLHFMPGFDGSVEGLYLGRAGGFYLLQAAELLVVVEGGQVTRAPLEPAGIPEERVAFIEVLGRAL